MTHLLLKIMSTSDSNMWEIQIDDGKWTREQTQILINTWKEYKHVLLNSNSSSSENFKIWRIISCEVNKVAPPKTLQQCKKKFRNMRYICKTAIQNNQQCNAKKHYPLFYDDFVEILTEAEIMKNSFKEEDSTTMIHEDHSAESSQHGVNLTNSSQLHERKPEDESSKDDRPNHISNQYDSPHVDTGKELSTTNFSLYNRDASESSTHSPIYQEQRENNGPSYSPQSVTDSRLQYDFYKTKEKNNQNSEVESIKPLIVSDSQQQFVGHGSRPYSFYEEGEGRYSRKHRNVSIMGPSYIRPKRMKHSPSGTDNHARTIGNNMYLQTSKTSQRRTSTISPDSSNSVPNRDNGISTSNIFPSTTTMPELNSHERCVLMQERQMDLFNSMMMRHEQFLLTLLKQQKEAAEEAQKRDREFMLKLVEIFTKNK